MRILKCRLTTIEEMLGTASNNKELHSEFIASHAPDAPSREEEIAAGAVLEFSVLVMADELMPAVKEWLSYGKLRGLGQWRNSGKGRFLCEILEERAAEFSDILD